MSTAEQQERYYKFFNEQNSNATEKKFKFLGSCTTSPDGFLCEDVNLRILLISDFMGPCRDEHPLIKCDFAQCPCSNCGLRNIVPLLKGDKYSEHFKANTYWDESMGSYCLTKKLTVKDYWDGKEYDKAKARVVEDALIKNIETKKEFVQIVNVGDLESAEVLMCFCKFDVVLLDKPDLFDFFLGTNCSDEEFRNAVKLNRGPLDKYWVLSLNEGFLKELQQRDVRLTDHRWNVFIGTDPKAKPNEFLYRLNEIIDLQLRLSVFRIKTLLTFLIYTCEDVKDHVANKVVVYDRGKKMRKVNDDELFFEGFQDFMGAEYANLMKRYGARKLIERDAFKEGDKYNKSLFATFVNKSFYLQRPVEKELIRLMRSFYHQASSMFNDRNGRQRLRESFEALRNFISYNGLVTELTPETSKRFLDGMKFLRAVIDSDFYLIKMKKWL